MLGCHCESRVQYSTCATTGLYAKLIYLPEPHLSGLKHFSFPMR